ncbi:MAG: hypothetical protein EU548_00235 [Promethearchaeota archaeon]|nr:MAG: hypothetical protein EU548_00235 [Candidatus Lokiarchaeota archaeon]
MALKLSKNKIIQEKRSWGEDINIIVKFLSAWPAAIGNDKIIDLTVEKGTSILDLLDYFNEKFGDIFSQIREKIIILLNGQHITALDGLNTTVKKSDKITMFLPYSGG